MRMNRAIFLDRDGTINVDVDYLHEPGKLVFIEGTFEALRLLKQTGYKLIVISNQSGIGRGYYTSAETKRLHAYMNDILRGQGAAIDAFYYCPHVERDACTCRKPETGLVRQAVQEWDIELSASYMVGDKETDVLTAVNAGCDYGLVLSGHAVPENIREKYRGRIYKDLREFAETICM